MNGEPYCRCPGCGECDAAEHRDRVVRLLHDVVEPALAYSISRLEPGGPIDTGLIDALTAVRNELGK